MTELGGNSLTIFVIPTDFVLRYGGTLEIRKSPKGGHFILLNGENLLDKLNGIAKKREKQELGTFGNKKKKVRK